MNKVVKCKNGKCEQHFMYIKEHTKCPFCYTEYGEVEEKTKEKEETTSTKKEFFKIKIIKKNQDEK